ncbi:MAG: PSD1 domain-containing protein, partial [Verrucomicrobiae bacterium]|nr:PSD1 domain-containing protein [Verrucomicrobiae bacterium]
MNRLIQITGLAVLGLGRLLSGAEASALTDAQREFFESRIRPVLAQECYECHSEATKAKGGLLLDSRSGWQKGGDSGPVIDLANPGASLLLRSLTHEIEDLKMPKNGAKLDAPVLEDIRQWIAMGAPDPRDRPPSPEEVARDTDWTAVSARRAQWWSFRPITNPPVPEGAGATHPVDRFIRARLSGEGLEPSPPADPRTLLRRLSFNLTGLPPATVFGEQTSVIDDRKTLSDKEWTGLVDALLASPAFGERWARHWMDWVRYADTHGSEGDPAIPSAWRYRDYLIRAFNEDVPVDRLILEHFAGDLLDDPRINTELKLNESALGTGHLRMVFHGFSPTDALDERVRFTDDQINTVTKAFLGLTVSCARCHDHKFDAISQKDYYALFGIFTSTLPATVAVDAPGVLDKNRDQLSALKRQIREGIAAHWLAGLPRDPERWQQLLKSGTGPVTSPSVSFLGDLAKAEPSESLARVWSNALAKSVESMGKTAGFTASAKRRWDLSDPDEYTKWSHFGEGLSANQPSPAGDYTLSPDGPVVGRILPSGVHSHLLSTRHRAFLASAPFDLEAEYELYYRVAGEVSSARYVVQHYPRSGTIFPVTNLNEARWRWVKYDLAYWKGDRLHLEFATGGDAPILVNGAERSWFGVREAVLVPKGSPAPPNGNEEGLSALFAAGSEAPADFASAMQRVDSKLRSLIGSWGKGDRLTDAEAILLDEILATGWLPNTFDVLPAGLATLVSSYRDLEAGIPFPTRAPGVWEQTGLDQPLYIRGDHKQPSDPVPRRFLEAIDSTPYATKGTGRLEFARDLVSEKNPFTARVLVNRVWHHLFGEGLVTTTDNFGRLGEEPSHPELLDHLAWRFRHEMNWSLKSLVRELVLSETWRQAGGPSLAAREKDPDNRLLSSYPLRRLEAEAIRDSLLAVSGQLDSTRYGEPVTGTAPRRSVYLRVKRNDLDPFLTTFDFPTPASSVGRRDVTNVPAQSLTLLNDPFLLDQAERWSARLLAKTEGSGDEARVRAFFEEALNRLPTEAELAGAKEFLASLDNQHRADAERFSSIQQEQKRLETELAALVDPVRSRLEARHAADFASRSEGSDPIDSSSALRPVAHWDFKTGTSDLVSGIDLKLEGSARIDAGSLVVDGKGHAESVPLPFALRAKTLEATVQLATLEQAAGGVMTVQTLDGVLFDSIVYAERRKGEWLAGSNGFARTLDFNGPAEMDAASGPVHLL